MTNYASKLIAPILNGDVRTVEVKKKAEVAYTKDIQEKLKKTVWMSGGCRSWYFDTEGWNSTLLPYNQIWFWWRCTFPYYRHWRFSYTRKGLVKLLLRRGLKVLALVATILGVVRLRRKAREEEMTVREYVENLRDIFKMGVKMGAVVGINKTITRLKDARTSILS
jgi:hypothetical protein